jgi:hypothetical protein
MPKRDVETVALSRDDLLLLINALNYVTHGAELPEFATLMGATREEAARLLKRLARAAE